MGLPRWAAGAALAIALAAPAAAAGDFDQALAAAQRGDYAVAFCIWRPMAEAGDPRAQYHLGWMYANGEGLRVDEERAVALWSQAAQQGHTEARFRLALAYLYGEGVERDTAQALAWLEPLAREGDDDARRVLRHLAADGNPAAVEHVRWLLTNGGWEDLGPVLTVAVERANLRERPSTDSRVPRVLEQGARLLALVRNGPWLRVGVPVTGAMAWVHESVVTIPEDE